MLSKLLNKVSFRAALIVPFVILTFTAVGLTTYLSLYHSRQAVLAVVHQLHDEIITHVQHYLQVYLETPYRINQLNTSAVQLGLLDVRDPALLKRHFWQQLKAFDIAHAIYFGNPQGGLVLVRREENGIFLIDETDNFISGDYHIFATDSVGNQQQRLEVAPPYDARLRPWYRAAQQAAQPIYAPPFIIYPKKSFGISSSWPIYDATGVLQGVFAADLISSQLSNFIKDIKIGKQSKIFIIERSGLLIASVDDPVLFRLKLGVKLVNVYQLQKVFRLLFARQVLNY